MQLRRCSSRATITSTRFVNHYEWGDLKGDPRRWMERYFDAFLYVAETRPEAAIGTLGHLLDALRRHLRDLPDTEMLRAFCERLCEVTVTAARRARGSKAETVLARLIDTYLDDRTHRWAAAPALLAQARLGKRIRRRLAAEVTLRSDTADPGRAERLTLLTAALSADSL